MKTKIAKLLSLLVVVTLVLGCVVSCGEPTAEKVVQKATKEMAKSPCRVTMDMSFSSDDPTYNRILSMMSVENMKMEINGDNVRVTMNMDVGGAETRMDYTVVDGTLYMKATVSAYGETQTVKQKAEISAAELDDLLADLNVSQDMNLEDFADVTMKQDGDTYVITCKGLTGALNKALRSFTEGIEEAIDGFIEVVYADYVIKVKDDKITSASLTCTYSMTIGSEEIEFSMTSDMTYKYDDKISVSAPSDASDYEEVDYDELVPA
jgi:hypothetical protein